jgi:hypothetical protein
MENHVVEAIVAVDDRCFVAARQVRRQPFDQPIQFGDALGFRREILLRPAADLTLDVIAGLSVIAEADGHVVDAVQRRDHPVHFVVMRGALAWGHFRQARVPQHAAFDILHQVELRADHRVVVATREHSGDGHVGRGERRHHAILAIDCVRRRQQLSRRLSTEHHPAIAGGDAISRVRLSALELLDAERAGEVADFPADERGQRVDIERVDRRNELRAGIGVAAHFMSP